MGVVDSNMVGDRDSRRKPFDDRGAGWPSSDPVAAGRRLARRPVTHEVEEPTDPTGREVATSQVAVAAPLTASGEPSTQQRPGAI